MHPFAAQLINQGQSDPRHLSVKGQHHAPMSDAETAKRDNADGDSFQHFFEVEAAMFEHSVKPPASKSDCGLKNKVADDPDIVDVEADTVLEIDTTDHELKTPNSAENHELDVPDCDIPNSHNVDAAEFAEIHAPEISKTPTQTVISSREPLLNQPFLPAESAGASKHQSTTKTVPISVVTTTQSPSTQAHTIPVGETIELLLPSKELDTAMIARPESHPLNMGKQDAAQTLLPSLIGKNDRSEAPHKISAKPERHPVEKPITTEVRSHTDKIISAVSTEQITRTTSVGLPLQAERAMQQIPDQVKALTKPIPAIRSHLAQTAINATMPPSIALEPIVDQSQRAPIPHPRGPQEYPRFIHQTIVSTSQLSKGKSPQNPVSMTSSVTLLQTQPASSKAAVPETSVGAPTDGLPASTMQNSALPPRAELPIHIARQLAEVVQQMPSRPVQITLSPDELGRVRLSVATSEGGIVVNVLTERPETLDLLRRHIDQLTQEFQTLGYQDIAFSFAGAGGDTASDDKDTSSEEFPIPTELETGTTNTQIHLSTGTANGLDLRL